MVATQLVDVDSLLGQRVHVYWDSHRRSYSLKQGGRVVAKSCSVWLTDVNFVVRASGVRLVRVRDRKVPHAFVSGLLAEAGVDGDAAASPGPGWLRGAVPFGYNPRKDESFVRLPCRTPLMAAEAAWLGTVGNRPVCYAQPSAA